MTKIEKKSETLVLSLFKDVQLVGVSDLNTDRGIDTASKYRVRFFEKKTIEIELGSFTLW